MGMRPGSSHCAQGRCGFCKRSAPGRGLGPTGDDAARGIGAQHPKPVTACGHAPAWTGSRSGMAFASAATLMCIVWCMGQRKRPALAPWHFGPPGICDACGCPCGTMDQAGIVCYACKAGVFMPRGFWQFAPCPACKGTDSFCTCCEGRNCIATPAKTSTLMSLNGSGRRSSSGRWISARHCPGRLQRYCGRAAIGAVFATLRRR